MRIRDGADERCGHFISFRAGITNDTLITRDDRGNMSAADHGAQAVVCWSRVDIDFVTRRPPRQARHCGILPYTIIEAAGRFYM